MAAKARREHRTAPGWYTDLVRRWGPAGPPVLAAETAAKRNGSSIADALGSGASAEDTAQAWGARARMADARRVAGAELDAGDIEALRRYPTPPRIPTTAQPQETTP